MESRENRSGLALGCESCGAPLHFDIIRQNDGCLYCGTELDLGKVFEQAKESRQLPDSGALHQSDCANCGAEIYFAKDSQSGSCPFCGHAVLALDFFLTEHFPVAIVPFSISPKEAKEQLEAFCQLHKKSDEAKRALAHVESLQQIYLPYELYQGEVAATLQRSTFDGSNVRFSAKSFLHNKMIAATHIIDNELLDKIEPFDAYGLKDFDPMYLAGHPAKSRDISEARFQEIASKELISNFQEEAGQALHDPKVRVIVEKWPRERSPVLLPVYYMNTHQTQVVINGQTGAVGIKKAKEKKSIPWIVEPLALSGLAFLLTFAINLFRNRLWVESPADLLQLLYFSPADRSFILQWPFLASLVFFLALRNGRGILIRPDYLVWHAEHYFRDAYGKLNFAGKPSQESAIRKDFSKIVFFQDDLPVRIRFYSPKRVMGWAIAMIGFLSTTLWLGLLLQNLFPKKPMLMNPFPNEVWIGGMVAWWTLAIPVAFILYFRVFRAELYNFPIVDAYAKTDFILTGERYGKNQYEGSGAVSRTKRGVRKDLAILKRVFAQSGTGTIALGLLAFVGFLAFMLSYISAFR